HSRKSATGIAYLPSYSVRRSTDVKSTGGARNIFGIQRKDTVKPWFWATRAAGAWPRPFTPTSVAHKMPPKQFRLLKSRLHQYPLERSAAPSRRTARWRD